MLRWNYDPPAREEFLQQACGSDTELRKEVQSLLDSAEKSIDFVPQAVQEVAQKLSADDGHEDVGRRLPRRRPHRTTGCSRHCSWRITQSCP